MTEQVKNGGGLGQAAVGNACKTFFERVIPVYPEEVAHGPKGIVVEVTSQSNHCICSLLFSEEMTTCNQSLVCPLFG